ncbi:hypothetical protein EDD80_102325 [Anseongella ginsenosidimutans]|uniref:DUF456 domain-containing protein n=1 Tax=Anseongella ginsenosidimutans TaxID=496056 RepID=A0A4R3KVJ6_9SPHI|nr:DUF456 domain-containing protein [Anseongella ginsenosidimutans]QEC51763.1 DUF456 domain-containing protein [Anseongella ginsenosidimutans]TCS89131.1 hypothetical protein EDD80_102325 [Anseongella ginsenosidimutans]
MDVLFVILAGAAIIIGILGSFLPVLPGPPIAWAGLLLLHYSEYAHFSQRFLIITAIITIAVTALDYIVPIWGTKKYGGSKMGQYGAIIGMLAGLFAGPVGIIFGPFIGAFIGELIHDPQNQARALRAAWGSFIGFLVGAGLKIVLCLVFAWFYVEALLF